MHVSSVHVQAQVSAATSLKTDIIKSLSLYYYTFVDILDFKVSFSASWLYSCSSFTLFLFCAFRFIFLSKQ